jgi:hypothetical protein
MRPLLNAAIVAQEEERGKHTADGGTACHFAHDRRAKGPSKVTVKTLTAHWIGSGAERALHPDASGSVLATFARVCDLVTTGGAVIALGWNGVERGPLTVLLDAAAGGSLAGLPVGARFHLSDERLTLHDRGSHGVSIDLSRARSWDARPDWKALRARRKQILSGSRAIVRTLIEDGGAVRTAMWDGPLALAEAAVHRACDGEAPEEQQRALGKMCGLGEGLTPQGDDWLAGWLLALRLAPNGQRSGRDVDVLGAYVSDSASVRSPLLSRAMLASAAAGEAPESWHELLYKLAGEADALEIERAARSVLAHGATSGAAMLRGFLAGLELERGSTALSEEMGAA